MSDAQRSGRGMRSLYSVSHRRTDWEKTVEIITALEERGAVRRQGTVYYDGLDRAVEGVLPESPWWSCTTVLSFSELADWAKRVEPCAERAYIRAPSEVDIVWDSAYVRVSNEEAKSLTKRSRYRFKKRDEGFEGPPEAIHDLASLLGTKEHGCSVAVRGKGSVQPLARALVGLEAYSFNWSIEGLNPDVTSLDEEDVRSMRLSWKDEDARVLYALEYGDGKGSWLLYEYEGDDQRRAEARAFMKSLGASMRKAR